MGNNIITQHKTGEQMYTLKKIAELLNIHYASVHRMIHNNEISHYCFGRKYRISESQLQEYLSKTTINAKAQ